MTETRKRWTEFDKYLWYMENQIFPAIKYEPTEEQWGFHRARERVRLLAGGERAGKSFCGARDLVARSVYLSHLGKERQLYWIMGPDYYQPRAEFEYILADLVALGFPLVGKPSMPRGISSAWTMTVAKVGEITTKTSADLMKIASFAPDGILMAEAAQQEFNAYLKCRGRIAEKRGWLLMSGTFESSLGWYADTFTLWKQGFGNNRSFSLPTWSNLKIYPLGRDDPEIKALEYDTPEDLFMERYGAVPFKPHTLVFREFSFTRNVKGWCVYDEDIPVHLAVDPGYDPGYYHVSAIQFHDDIDGKKEQVWQVDEIHRQRMTAPEIINLCKKKPWWDRVVNGVIDIAGRQHHAQKSQVEIWRELAGVHLDSNPVSILDGIERHRTMLKDPETSEARLFHNPNNIHTLAEYGKYKRAPDKETGNLKEIPIDRDNHAMKAIAYLLYDHFGPVKRLKRKKGRVAIL